MGARECPDAKFDPEKGNEIRVTTQGPKATIFLNGVEVAAFKGQPPKGGHSIGLYVEGGAVEFDDLKVMRAASGAGERAGARPRIGSLPRSVASRSLTPISPPAAGSPRHAPRNAALDGEQASSRQNASSFRSLVDERQPLPAPSRRR